MHRPPQKQFCDLFSTAHTLNSFMIKSIVKSVNYNYCFETEIVYHINLERRFRKVDSGRPNHRNTNRYN